MEQQRIKNLAEVIVQNIKESIEDDVKSELDHLRSKISLKKEPFLRQIIGQQNVSEQNETEKKYSAHDVLNILEEIAEELDEIIEGYARDEE